MIRTLILITFTHHPRALSQIGCASVCRYAGFCMYQPTCYPSDGKPSNKFKKFGWYWTRVRNPEYAGDYYYPDAIHWNECSPKDCESCTNADCDNPSAKTHKPLATVAVTTTPAPTPAPTTTEAPTTTKAALYVATDYGKDTCTKGTKVESEDDCRTAGTAHFKGFKLQRILADYPKGCFVFKNNQQAFYNPNQKDPKKTNALASPICYTGTTTTTTTAPRESLVCVRV